MMGLRGVAALVVAAVAFAVPLASASANTLLLEEILTGGAPRGRMPGGFNELFGGGSSSPVPRTTVNFSSAEPPGTIIINTSERRLYLVMGNGQALRYGIGVGRVGFTWAGRTRVIAKKEWPDWTPPKQMLRRRPDLPRFM